MKSLLTAGLALLILEPAPTAQQLQLPPPPAFRVGAFYVEVDAIVQDKNGTFVPDLGPDDFQVLEEGKPQRVDLLYVVNHGATAPSKPDGASAGASDGAAAGGSGSLAVPARLPRVMIVLFDTDHLSPGNFKRVQNAALELLSKQFDPGDVAGIVTNGEMVNRRLTSDREELIKAVKNARPGLSGAAHLVEEQTWPRMNQVEAYRVEVNKDVMIKNELIRRACQDDPSQCDLADNWVVTKAQEITDQTRQASNATLRTIMGVLTGLAHVDARKSLVLLSEGFLCDESWPLMREALTLAARANARIYSLDARGLSRGLTSVLDLKPAGDDPFSRMALNEDSPGDSINSLAVDTGGFVVRNVNVFDKAVARIVDENSRYYVLGYRPELQPDNKYRRISVKMKRAGLSVRARRGYVASPPAALMAGPPASASPGAPGTPKRPTPITPTAMSEPLPETTALPETVPLAVSNAAVPAGTRSGEVRVRPDALENVGSLAGGQWFDTAAKAGWDAYQRGDLESARASLGTAARNPRADVWVHYALGQSEYALGEYQSAAQSWEKVRSAAPSFEPVYFDLVDAYVQLKARDVAIRVLRAAEARWPVDPEVSNALGVVQVRTGALDEAVKSFTQAVAKAPADANGYFNLGTALELRYGKSRRYYVPTKSWIGNDDDRKAAIENYQRYLSIGGPFEKAARDGLTRLTWTPKQVK